MISTARLILRRWREADGDSFAALHADSEVMWDLGGPIGRAASDAKLARYVAAWKRDHLGRWVVATPEDAFLGYCGVMHADPNHRIGTHWEIGWRLSRSAWGRGYATEAASAALRDAFERVGCGEVLAYTAPDNLRSQAVMKRLSLRRDPNRDFVADDTDASAWRGLVWVAAPDGLAGCGAGQSPPS